MSFVINQTIKYSVVQEREILFENKHLVKLNKYIHKNYNIDENFECTMEDVKYALSDNYERLQVRVISKDKTSSISLKCLIRYYIEEYLDTDSDWRSEGKWKRDTTLETIIDEDNDDYF